ncbi:MAG: T9SS type A sorting domain-containing protein [bacterium]|nr:T9SS type A sorting domain-containing protein [bacterium]
MNRIFIFLLFLLCFGITFSVENTVPVGTTGNRLVFTVRNASSVNLIGPRVTVDHAPEWVMFREHTIQADSVPALGFRDFLFDFDVAAGEAGKDGIVRLNVFDNKGRILSGKNIAVQSSITSNRPHLYPPYPNPANPNNTIRFVMPQAGKVRVEVFNSLGQLTRRLISEEKPAGLWDLEWDGKDGHGAETPSGVYVIRMETVIRGVKTVFSSKIILQR